MKHHTWLAGPAAWLLTVSAAHLVQASPTSPGATLTGTRFAAKGAGKAGKAGKKGKKGNGPANRDIRQLEQVLGKPLTPEQRQGVVDAYQAYHESVAKSVGLTTEELDARTKAYRAAHPGQGRRGAGAGAATPPTTAAPATTPPA